MPEELQMARLPPLSSLAKSRDVEDPVNCWVHRPLAYALVLLIHRTAITPNIVTVLAMLCGVTAGALWIAGSPAAMLAGGALLWTSSILDGADGILARAKGIHSELGRALDGTADHLVALATVGGAFFHLWAKHHDPAQLPFMAIALATAVVHIFLYDFYKEAYLDSINPGWDGRTPGSDAAQARLVRLRERSTSWVVRFALDGMAGMLKTRDRMRRIVDRGGDRSDLHFTVNADSIRIHRQHNRWPMQLWALISLCPHTYLMSIAAMFDRLDLYLWFRVVAANAIFVVALIWQRIATVRTLRDLARAGIGPRPAGDV